MLFRDLLIRVTSFFRDQETFKTLESKVIPLLFQDKHADATVRLWVPGCATGEEAYSLAILLCEYMDRMNGAPKVQIFATDIDDFAITAARLGRYPAGLLEGLSPERIERFFTMSHGSLRREQGDPQSLHVFCSQSGSRPTLFDDEPGLLPQSADLHECRAAGEGHPRLSLRADTGRHPVVRRRGIGRAASGSVFDRG